MFWCRNMEFPYKFSRKVPDVTKIRSASAALLHRDGRTDMTKLTVAVSERTAPDDTVSLRTDCAHAQIEAAVVLLVNLIVMEVPLVLRRRTRLATAVVVALCGCGAQFGVRVLLRWRATAL